jgi:hypothetical protein
MASTTPISDELVASLKARLDGGSKIVTQSSPNYEEAIKREM